MFSDDWSRKKKSFFFFVCQLARQREYSSHENMGLVTRRHAYARMPARTCRHRNIQTQRQTEKEYQQEHTKSQSEPWETIVQIYARNSFLLETGRSERISTPFQSGIQLPTLLPLAAECAAKVSAGDGSVTPTACTWNLSV